MSYEIEKARMMVIQAGLECKKSGLIARTWGNISARISDTQFAITPSGRDYETLTPDQIVICNISDCSYQGLVKPSSEKWIHAVGYAERPDVDFIIHTHQNYASAVSVLGRDVDVADTLLSSDPLLADGGIDAAVRTREYSLLGPVIPCASYGLNGSTELRDAVKHAIVHHRNSNAIFMKNHGVECLGTSYKNAFEVAHALEAISMAYYQDLASETIEPESESWYRLFNESTEETSYYADVMIPGHAFGIMTDSPYIVQMSRYGKGFRPYLDDQAQIIGLDLGCIQKDASIGELESALAECNAVLVQGEGAICVGESREDAEAACQVLEKGCRAAYLAKMAGNIEPISEEHARIDRNTYLTSYSKLMTQI